MIMTEKFVAVVTGGGKGIGAGICKLMVQNGYEVISVGKDSPDWEHKSFKHIELDLLDQIETEKFAKTISSQKNVTHLIHNAGVILPNLLEDVEIQDLITLTNLHAGAALILMKSFLPSMKKNNFGRLVFISSRALVGLETRTAYSYSKAGIVGMARTWALELASSGITVNSIAPGPVLTDQFWTLVEKDGDQQKKIAKSIPVGRIGEPEDIARTVMFFSNPDNSFVTGQTLFVCGGTSITSY